MTIYRALRVQTNGSAFEPIEVECADDREAEARIRDLIGPYQAAALYEGDRIVKLMRAKPKP
jgi:hypothetical protein